MTPDRIDESPNRNDSEGWHCPDCQSWGPFTVDVNRRVMLSEDETPFLDNEGDTDDDRVFARCPDCQRQAPVSSFRFEGALMDDPERHVRAGWTQQGIDHVTPAQIVADFTATPQRGVWVGPFQIPDESPIVGTERTPS